MARRKLSSEINVVPYIDVMLVLLIIFMVTAPLLTQGVEIDLPDANAQSMSSQEEDRVVRVAATGEVRLSFAPDPDRPITDEELVQIVSAVMRNKPDAMILVRGDEQVRYGRVAQTMALLHEAGARKIGFVMEPQPAAPDDDAKP